ncbi:MAG: acyltransferase domain-containing protein, partial [Pseudobdellovibrionaceae bacterium]
MASSHTPSGKNVFMFPGQGSFTDTLLTEIVEAYPELNRRVEIASSIIRKQFGKDLGNIVYSSASMTSAEPIENDFELSQCVIYLTGYFLQETLISKGLSPDIMIGHSVGEIPALAAAGAFSFEDGLRITCMRTHAIQQYAREGKMYAINAPAAQIQHLIQFIGDSELCVAVVNGKTQTVVSGSTHALAKLLKLAEAAGLISTKLKSAYPFHSSLMLKAVPSFSNSIHEIRFLEPTISVYSPILGRFYEKQDDLKEILAFQLVQPVNFSEGIGHLYAQGARSFFETGGKNSLTALSRSILENHIGFSAHECQRKSVSLKESMDQAVRNGKSQAAGLSTTVIASSPTQVKVIKATPPVSSSEVQNRVLKIFKDLTNYPEEILELDADLESDLGLDSVKQIEIMSALMKEFSIPAQENIEIAKYNTIRKTVDYIAQQLATG